MTTLGPHTELRPISAGLRPEDAPVTLILVHGRGGDARDMLALGETLGRQDLAYIAPQAAGHTWYPQSFMAPVAANEPGRSSGLSVLGTIVEILVTSGIPSEQIVLAGFSQGACLTLEFVARHARRFGAVVGLTGGLIGPPDSLHGYDGSLEGTPVFLGSGDPDAHVPWSRVEKTASVLQSLGGEVTCKCYPGRRHTVSRDELEIFASLVGDVASRSAAA